MAADRADPLFGPLTRSVVVPCKPADAFAIFTERMGEWWPLAEYSVYRGRAVRCGIEPRAGGDIFEIRDDGERCVWGRVVDWAPPRRLILAWHPGLAADEAQEVEIRFTAIRAGTRVDLEHRGWHRLGERAIRIREGYDRGWTTVLEMFTTRANHNTKEDA